MVMYSSLRVCVVPLIQDQEEEPRPNHDTIVFFFTFCPDQDFVCKKFSALM